jgi:hypothetical protein
MKRGAPIIAEYLGGAVNCDAYHMTDPRADGLGVSSCIESSLEDAGVSPEEVFSFPPPHKLIFLLHGALFFFSYYFSGILLEWDLVPAVLFVIKYICVITLFATLFSLSLSHAKTLFDLFYFVSICVWIFACVHAHPFLYIFSGYCHKLYMQAFYCFIFHYEVNFSLLCR